MTVYQISQLQIDFIINHMDVLESNQSPSQAQESNQQMQTNVNVELSVTELSQCMLDYYVKLRSDELSSLSVTIPEQFIKIQSQIIQIVELRKTMQKSIEIDVMQSQHFGTISELIKKTLELQKTINVLAQQIKSNQSQQINSILLANIQQVKNNANYKNNIAQKGEELIMELNEFRRNIDLSATASSNIQINKSQNFSEYFKLKQQQQQKFIQKIIQEQRQKWKLGQLICKTKMDQLALREQMLEERQKGFLQYERTNNELIQILLREKERDKNLRKKDKEKFEEMLKIRHQIDVENQNLSHSEKTLNSHYQVELLKIKNILSFSQQTHSREIKKLQQQNLQLREQLTLRDQSNLRKELTIQQKQLEMEEAIKQLKFNCELIQEQKRHISSELKQLQIKCVELQENNNKFKKQIGCLQKINQQRFKEVQLLNEKYHKSHKQLLQYQEQINHMKIKLQRQGEIIKQLEDKYKQKENQTENYKIKLANQSISKEQMQEQLDSLNTSIKILQAKDKTKQYLIQQYQQKIQGLESELVKIFIMHNQDRKLLEEETDSKQYKINQLNQEIIITKQTLQHQITIAEENKQKLEGLVIESIKSQLMEQIKRSEIIKLMMIDQMVDRLDQIII